MTEMYVGWSCQSLRNHNELKLIRRIAKESQQCYGNDDREDKIIEKVVGRIYIWKSPGKYNLDYDQSE